MDPEIGLALFGYALIGVVFGFFCGRVAEAKGLDKGMWWLGGFFFSIAALIAVAGMPSMKK